MSVGIVLVHGYSGSPEDLEYLAENLTAKFGHDAVSNIRLPGHGTEDAPLFNPEIFVSFIAEAFEKHRARAHKIVLLGHSTGGSLVLAFLSKIVFRPNLLILAAVPKEIKAAHLERWNQHRSGKTDIPFTSLAKMITTINIAGSVQFDEDFPVLFIHGQRDKLVLPSDAAAWQNDGFAGLKRFIWIPSGNHQLFSGQNRKMAVEAVQRAVEDVANFSNCQESKIMDKLKSVESEVERFLTISSYSAAHLARCPSGRNLIHDVPDLNPYVNGEPVLANIEITGRCNLACRFCARTWLPLKDGDMPLERFIRVLDMLPHAYRITIVGLGEPLMHTEVTRFVAEASARGRRVTLVTNAMFLDEQLSEQLLKAGLSSIAFSIDTDDQLLADELRPGSDMNQLMTNIRGFMRRSISAGSISTAVFTAVSFKTVARLKHLVDAVADLGVHVLMLTDLNFRTNLKNTLWKNATEEMTTTIREAVSYAFSKNLPVLSVHALEEFGLQQRYRDYLLLSPEQLAQRSPKNRWCRSPWQTIAVDIEGNAAVCDCQPEKQIGNILRQPLSEIWNGKDMINYRRQMLGPNPPRACTICPRF